MARYQVDHDLYKGWILKRRDVSIYLNIMGYGQVLNEDQLQSFIKANNVFRQVVGQIDPRYNEVGAERLFQGGITSISDNFPDTKDDVAYKYVSKETLEFMLNGCFQLGTAEYYRSTPNESIRDGKEGREFIHFTEEDKQIHFILQTGCNAYIFCSTKEIGQRDLMHNRFGSHLIRINRLRQFANRVAQQIGAKNFHVYDVVYNDFKNYKLNATNIYKFKDIFYEWGQAIPLTKELLEKTNRRLFPFFHDIGRLPCIFTKPTYYKDENERRLIFEFNHDVKNPIKRFVDKKLLDYIEVM